MISPSLSPGRLQELAVAFSVIRAVPAPDSELCAAQFTEDFRIILWQFSHLRSS